jgi:hypothetical protein
MSSFRLRLKLTKEIASLRESLRSPASPELHNALEEIYKYPLQETARDTLNRQLRSGVSDEQLSSLVIDLRTDNRLCQVQVQLEPEEPRIICSLGLFDTIEVG